MQEGTNEPSVIDIPSQEAAPDNVRLNHQQTSSPPPAKLTTDPPAEAPPAVRPLRSVKIAEEFLSSQASEAISLLVTVDEVNALPVATEPEWLEVECCLDTGSSVHAVNRLDIPGCDVVESPGSRAGQQFQTAGGALIDNEGQALLMLVPPDADTRNPVSIAMQVAKVTRPLISVPKLTEGDKLRVVCKETEALVQTPQGQLVARFKKKGGLYVCLMRIKNPKWTPFTRPA
jgi:hypothetical protein